MPNLSLTNCEIIVGGLDMSSYLNKAIIKSTAAELDGTTFGQTYRVRLAGLKDTHVFWDGFWTSVPDAAQFAQLGNANQAMTISPQGAEGKLGSP